MVKFEALEGCKVRRIIGRTSTNDLIKATVKILFETIEWKLLHFMRDRIKCRRDYLFREVEILFETNEWKPLHFMMDKIMCRRDYLFREIKNEADERPYEDTQEDDAPLSSRY